MRMIDLTSQTFNRWTVIQREPNSARNQTRWLCRCACGTERVLYGMALRHGYSRSCGCLKIEETVRRSTKHGHSPLNGSSPTYHSWAGMIARCTNPKHSSYRRYGGRNISVCKQWFDFVNFLADMGEKPQGRSIERRDRHGNYEPKNCYWATPTQQARNKSNNTLLTLNGKTKTIAEWAEITGLHYSAISYRIHHGWSHERALTTPSRNTSM